MIRKNLMSGKKSKIQERIERLCANREWIDRHIDELTAQHKVGDWIAILGGKVIAQGTDSGEVKAKLGGQFDEETILLCIPDKEIPQPI